MMLSTIKENKEHNYINEKISLNLALDILHNNISSISHMPFEIRDNEYIMLDIVKKDGLLLIYGSEKIQNNKSIIIASILSNKKVLDYAYININNFKNDKDILIAAICQEPILIANFPNDKELALKAISIDYNVFYYISPNLQKDEDIILLLLKSNNQEFIKNNYSVIIPALINNKNIINFININDPLINLIYEIEYNYENAYLNLKDIINNIEYISKTKNYKKLIKLLMSNYKNICLKYIKNDYLTIK